MKKDCIMKKPKVFNINDKDIPDDAIYIGRGSPYGNPYIIGKDGNRSQVIKKFEINVLPFLDLEPLRGKDLICFCKPKACHGDILIYNANKNELIDEIYE